MALNKKSPMHTCHIEDSFQGLLHSISQVNMLHALFRPLPWPDYFPYQVFYWTFGVFWCAIRMPDPARITGIGYSRCPQTSSIGRQLFAFPRAPLVYNLLSIIRRRLPLTSSTI